MKNSNAPLTDAEIKQIIAMRDVDKLSWRAIGRTLDRDAGAVQKCYRRYAEEIESHLDESPYPRYDSPLEDTGNALILPDPEIPFHNADFVNRCIDVAVKWDVTQLIVPGDLVHLAAFSGWEPNWKSEKKGGLNQKDERKLMDFAMTLSKNKQQELIDAITHIGSRYADDDISSEITEAREVLRKLTQAFKTATLSMGNHDGRFLRTLNSPLEVSELTNFLGIGTWRVAPYYHSFLTSNDERFCLSHPKPSGDSTPVVWADRLQCHYLMAHSHKIWQSWSTSGVYYAWHIGCCVDELRLPYVGQRHNNAQRTPHKNGAVIIRDGFPWMLHEGVDWKRLGML
jgi:hypothetical protein